MHEHTIENVNPKTKTRTRFVIRLKKMWFIAIQLLKAIDQQ